MPDRLSCTRNSVHPTTGIPFDVVPSDHPTVPIDFTHGDESDPGPGYSIRAGIVLRAMKRCGLIVADNGSDRYVQGRVDDRWTYRFVDQLKWVPARAFVPVDASACKVSAGSAAFAYAPECPVP